MEEYGRALRVGRTKGLENKYKEPVRFVGLRRLDDVWDWSLRRVHTWKVDVNIPILIELKFDSCPRLEATTSGHTSCSLLIQNILPRLAYFSVYMAKTGIFIGVIPLANNPAMPAQSISSQSQGPWRQQYFTYSSKRQPQIPRHFQLSPDLYCQAYIHKPVTWGQYPKRTNPEIRSRNISWLLSWKSQ